MRNYLKDFAKLPVEKKAPTNQNRQKQRRLWVSDTMLFQTIIGMNILAKTNNKKECGHTQIVLKKEIKVFYAS